MMFYQYIGYVPFEPLSGSPFAATLRQIQEGGRKWQLTRRARRSYIMDIQKMEFPSELLEHNLSAQELALIPEVSRPIAISWNIVKRQNEWMMREMVINRNILAVHDQQLEFWARVRWGVATVCGIIIASVAILKQLGVFK